MKTRILILASVVSLILIPEGLFPEFTPKLVNNERHFS